MQGQEILYRHTDTKTLANGTGAVLASYEIQFPEGYSKCVGVLAYPHQALFNIRLGMKQGQDTVQELTHPDDWKSDSTVAIQDRPKPILFNPSRKLTVYYQPLAALGADQTFDLVFLLQK